MTFERRGGGARLCRAARGISANRPVTPLGLRGRASAPSVNGSSNAGAREREARDGRS